MSSPRRNAQERRVDFRCPFQRKPMSSAVEHDIASQVSHVLLEIGEGLGQYGESTQVFARRIQRDRCAALAGLAYTSGVDAVLVPRGAAEQLTPREHAPLPVNCCALHQGSQYFSPTRKRQLPAIAVPQKGCLESVVCKPQAPPGHRCRRGRAMTRPVPSPRLSASNTSPCRFRVVTHERSGRHRLSRRACQMVG